MSLIESSSQHSGPMTNPGHSSTLDGVEAATASWLLRDRCAWVSRFRCRLAASEALLLDLMAADLGKPADEALTGDLLPLLAACRWVERRGARLLRARRLRGRPFWMLGQRHVVERRPLGHVGIIATWNYPLQLLGIQLLHALVAGNRVTVKPSELAPRTQRRLLDIAVEAGAPREMVRWTDPTREAGAAMLRENRFDHLIFTGSTQVGRMIAEHAARALTPTTLELSGRDSAFVLDDADARLAATTIWHAVVMNAGQTCMAPRRVFVERAVYREFLNALAPRTAGAKPVRLVTASAAAHAHALCRDAVDRGARSLSGVVEPPHASDMRPLAIVDCSANFELAAGDHFGPVMAVIPVASLDEAIAAHEQCDQHLATSIFTRSKHRARALSKRLRATSITINDAILPTAHPGASIGGVGASGWGVSRGESGLLAMTRPVFLSTTSTRWRVPLNEPTREVVSRMRRLVRGWYGGLWRRSPTPDLTRSTTTEARPSRDRSVPARLTQETAHGSLR